MTLSNVNTTVFCEQKFQNVSIFPLGTSTRLTPARMFSALEAVCPYYLQVSAWGIGRRWTWQHLVNHPTPQKAGCGSTTEARAHLVDRQSVRSWCVRSCPFLPTQWSLSFSPIFFAIGENRGRFTSCSCSPRVNWAAAAVEWRKGEMWVFCTSDAHPFVIFNAPGGCQGIIENTLGKTSIIVWNASGLTTNCFPTVGALFGCRESTGNWEGSERHWFLLLDRKI